MSAVLSAPETVYPHVRVVMGMVVGLSLAHLLTQLAKIIEYDRWRRLYWPHMLWVASTLVLVIHFWWWQLRLSLVAHWTFALYAFVTFYALLLYLLCSVVLPSNLADKGSTDYRTHYYARRGWFFGLLATIFVVDVIDTLLKGWTFLQSLGPGYWVRNGAYVVLSLIAARSASPRFHAVFAVAAFVFQLLWIATRYEVFG
jgi:hypothetical protein